MDPFCKNNYKNFLRRFFLPLILLLFTAWSLLKDELARASVVPSVYFNKTFTDTVPQPHPVTFPDRDSLAKDTARRPVIKRVIDTIPSVLPDSLQLMDSSRISRDSLRRDTSGIRISKDSLSAPVYYKAQDSIV